VLPGATTSLRERVQTSASTVCVSRLKSLQSTLPAEAARARPCDRSTSRTDSAGQVHAGRNVWLARPGDRRSDSQSPERSVGSAHHRARGQTERHRSGQRSREVWPARPGDRRCDSQSPAWPERCLEERRPVYASRRGKRLRLERRRDRRDRCPCRDAAQPRRRKGDPPTQPRAAGLRGRGVPSRPERATPPLGTRDLDFAQHSHERTTR
jgi:hypothetical protein